MEILFDEAPDGVANTGFYLPFVDRVVGGLFYSSATMRISSITSVGAE